MPGADYQDAHDRHWDDAELLLRSDRLANADHLYGLSAECGLKAVMRSQGALPMKGDAPERKDHKVHIDRFWDTYSAYTSGRASLRLGDVNPFNDWSVAQRYMHRDRVTTESVQTHRRGAKQVRDLVRSARWDGSIR